MPTEARLFAEVFDRDEMPGGFQLNLTKSLLFAAYFSLWGISDRKADNEPPIIRGPRRRPIPA